MLVHQYFAATLPEWEEVYRRQTLHATIYQQRLNAALRLVAGLGLAPGSTALDIGCGPGFGTIGLARHGFFVQATDRQPRMVARALERARVEGVRASVRGSACDIHSLSFADATFDVVLVVGVSEWLDTLERPLREVARVLKPGGHLVLTADNSWALSCILDPLQNPLIVPIKRALGTVLRRFRPRPTLRTHAYSIRALDLALARVGLARTGHTTLGFGPLSLFNQAILPDRVGHALHRRLAALASRPTSRLRSAGLVHVMAARRTR